MSGDEGSDVETKPKKAGTKRKAKAKGPKRALSAYMFFCQDKRPSVKEENPNAGFSEIGKLLGTMWAGLAPEDKVEYEKMNKQDKARYEAEKAENPAGDDEDEDDGGKKKKAKTTGKKKKDPNAPKSAPTAYMLFCAEERKKLKEAEPTLTFSEIGTKMGANWKALSDEDKKPYQTEHAKLKKKADAAKAAYAGTTGTEKKPKKAAKKAAKDEEEDAADDAEGGDDAEDGDE